MGYIVTCNEREIWKPSATVGFVYFEQIILLEKIIERESGVVSPFDDELEIDEDAFKNFLQGSVDFLQSSNNQALVSLFSGCIEVSIYIYFLITGTWFETPFELSFLNERARKIANLP